MSNPEQWSSFSGTRPAHKMRVALVVALIAFLAILILLGHASPPAS
jgi:hypothetical protein